MRFNIFAMPASSVVLLFSVAFGVSNALPWAEPQQTRVYQADAWSPAPTQLPADPAKLFKRSSLDVNICGWVGANSAKPAMCGSGSSCVHDTVHWLVGCCATSGPCTEGVYTACVDKNSHGWSPNSGLADNGIKSCTGDSVCYRNNFPGGYYQYTCGASSDATYVETTYSGMASDIQLQVVYTGIYFTPTSAPTTTPSATGSQPTSTTAPSGIDSVSSTTSSPTSSSTATAAPTKTNVGAIAGGTVAGLAVLVSLLALAFYLYKRHYQKNNTRYSRAGPFTSAHNTTFPSTSPNTSGPFQKLTPFSPDDLMIGNNTHITAGSGPGTISFPPTYAYAGGSDPHHPYANAPPTPYFPPPRSEASSDGRGHSRSVSMREGAPLVSEIEDFSRGYHDAIQARMRAEEIEGGRQEVVPSGEGSAGVGMGIAGIDAPLLSGHRAEDREARSEAFREQLRIRNEGWSSQALRGPTHGYGRVASGNGSDEEEEEEVEIPMRSPLRESLHGRGGLSAAVGRRTPDDERERERYPLVDQVVGDDVPILRLPGRRESRQ